MNRHWMFLVPLALLLTACGADPGHVWTWPEVAHYGLDWAGIVAIMWIMYVVSGRRR